MFKAYDLIWLINVSVEYADQTTTSVNPGSEPTVSGGGSGNSRTGGSVQEKSAVLTLPVIIGMLIKKLTNCSDVYFILNHASITHSFLICYGLPLNLILIIVPI